MDFRLKRYKRDFEHSYTFGVFPTLELLAHKAEQVLGVIVHPQGMENQGVAKIQEICQRTSIPLEFQEKTFPRLGSRDNDYAVGVFNKYQPSLDRNTDHIVLVNPNSVGNLGTIQRTMLGFGFSDLAIITPAVDHFDPRAIRASMGAIFNLRLATFDEFDTYQQMYSRTFYPLMTGGGNLINEVEYQQPFSLVFGNESRGLDEAYRNAGPCISIPQSEAIDSLNLAVAVGISLYQVMLAREP